MPVVRMPRLSVPVDDILDLVEQYDSWGGGLTPPEAEEWRERFATLKARAQQLYDTYPVENEAQALA